MDEKDISIDLSHCLGEWGVPKDEVHLECRRGVIGNGIGYFRARARGGDESSSIVEDTRRPSFIQDVCVTAVIRLISALHMNTICDMRTFQCQYFVTRI
jgi:hypothetical protein